MTNVDIANMALTSVGAEAVLVQIDDQTKEGRLCTQNYDLARRAVLAGSPWKFAIKRVKLDVFTPETPPFGYTSKFLLPQDYIRAVTVNDSHLRFVREGRYILCDEVGPINLRYVSDEPSVELFDPLFIDCVALDLATRICYALTQSNERLAEVEKQLVLKTRKARHTDACDQSEYHIIADDFESARLAPNRGQVPRDYDFPAQ